MFTINEYLYVSKPSSPSSMGSMPIDTKKFDIMFLTQRCSLLIYHKYQSHNLVLLFFVKLLTSLHDVMFLDTTTLRNHINPVPMDKSLLWVSQASCLQLLLSPLSRDRPCQDTLLRSFQGATALEAYLLSAPTQCRQF